MAKQLLPNGSVVTLKGATKKLMTIGIEVEMEGDEKTYDYIAIPYPEGYIDSETMFLFMQEDIENVSFVGFVDAEMQVFRTALEETDENDAEKESDSQYDQRHLFGTQSEHNENLRCLQLSYRKAKKK